MSLATHFSHSPTITPREQEVATKEQDTISKQQDVTLKQTHTYQDLAINKWTPIIKTAKIATPVVTIDAHTRPAICIPVGTQEIKIPKIIITPPDHSSKQLQKIKQNPKFLTVPKRVAGPRQLRNPACNGSFLKCKTGHKVDLGIRHTPRCVKSGFKGCSAAAWNTTAKPKSRGTCDQCAKVAASMSQGRYFKPSTKTAYDSRSMGV